MPALDALFAPRAIAVVGAGARTGSVGSRRADMIRDFGYRGGLYAVNPSGAASGEIPGFRSLGDIPEPVDLCLIAAPAAAVPDIVADCARNRVAFAQIFSSGFDEGGLARLRDAAGGVTRMIGPNCLGTHDARSRITFSRHPDRGDPGAIAIVSQSGGLSIDILHHARLRGLRIGKAVSIGDCVDLQPADFLEHLEADPDTSAIGFYLEGVKDVRFFSALRSAARHKPVVLLKGGRTEQGAASAISHTGALAGDYAVWSAAIAQAGATEARTIDEMLAILQAFSPGVPLPRGNGVALFGNGGGMTVLTTDALADAGMEAVGVSPETLAKLFSGGLPPGASMGKALDMPMGALSQAGTDEIAGIVSSIAADETVDLVLAHLNLATFLHYADPLGLAEKFASSLVSASMGAKPLYVGLRDSTDPEVEAIRLHLVEACSQASVPCFTGSVEAAFAAGAAWRRSRFLAASDTNGVEALPSPALERIAELLDTVRAAGRTLLTQGEAFALLAALDIAHPPIAFARNRDEAVALADAMGYPVALKVESPDIVHKSDSGGVRLGIRTAAGVAENYDAIVAATSLQDAGPAAGVVVQGMGDPPLVEMILGINRDPQFGPIVVAGAGGVFVELYRDVALRVAPVSRTIAGEMWRSLRAAPLIEGFRGRPGADTLALEEAIVKVSLAAHAFPAIVELDVNPLFLQPQGATAIDCRVRIT